jgi:hypothetical protein
MPAPRIMDKCAERVLSIAGASPKRMPAKTEMPKTYINTSRSGFTLRTRVPYPTGRASTAFVAATRSKVHVNGSAVKPASRASSALSVNNWRIKRGRLAPSDKHMPNSC